MTQLDDKYGLKSGRIYLTGTQALVRLPLMQRAADEAAGHNTGGFISGYRGSPLGGYDLALWRAKNFLSKANIHFQPGVNEDLAATAIWGSQQTRLFPGATVDGVFGIWYGKGPGVDRSTDALKHANLAGTAPLGGVLAVAGDDHNCQSSSAAHQSEQVFAAAMIPLLNPGSLQDYLDFGLYGFALSRFSGCWVGFKAVSQIVESSASLTLPEARSRFVAPADFAMPADGLSIRWPDWPLDQEKRLHGPKMDAVAAFARANPLDRVIIDSLRPRLGIFTTGKAYSDVRQALSDLGISESQASSFGIRLYKIGMAWPLEREGALRAAEELQEILVVEEKRAFIEDQLLGILYHLATDRRPRLVGKRDEHGKVLFPSEGELDPLVIAKVITARLAGLGADVSGLQRRLGLIEARLQHRNQEMVSVERKPFFCSGCPHNTSTRLPEGSRAGAGIGCHGMLTWMPYRNTTTITHMGGEGMMWVGQSPFTSEQHVFQNLGDGTYNHSGLLAIRGAAAAGVNITYKILYNDAVAMTGGQPVEGQPTVAQLTRQLEGEGARRIVVVTDEPEKFADRSEFARGVDVRHRDEMDAVQRELRETAGLTILIYDQTCAAEKRRRRKRGLFPDPPKRVFINDAVCEGCGDCSEKSHCISIVPLETEFGRKRQVDQSNCNKDFSCLKGFCPSFVTVHNGSVRRAGVSMREQDIVDGIPDPPMRPLEQPYSILIAGIGGTGVITVSAILGMAAHIEGKEVSVLDSTGLAQKNGGVLSHVRVATHPMDIHTAAVPPGGTDLLLACDMIFAAGSASLSRIGTGVTRAVVNSHIAPNAAFVTNGDVDFQAAAIRRTLIGAVGAERIDFIDGTDLAKRLTGDAVASNLIMLGYALQKGWIPIGVRALERAIELNGVAVAENRRALAYGRLAAHDAARIESMMAPPAKSQTVVSQTFEEMIERRARYLADYQDAYYASRYRALIEQVASVERSKAGRRHGLAEAAAQSLFKLMAYKDEYEVARLYASSEFIDKLKDQFEGDFRLSFHLAPPMLSRRDPVSGYPRKITFGGWMLHVFRLLAPLKRLRGTPFDLFGYSRERRMERALIVEYEGVLLEIIEGLRSDNHTLAVRIAEMPLKMRGFGHVKERNVEEARNRTAELLVQFRQSQSLKVAAE